MWRRDKSWVENFLSVCTPLLLAVAAVTSLALRYVRDPISCHYVYPQANEYFTEDCFQKTRILMRSEEFVRFSTQVYSQGSRADGFQNPFQLWPKQRTYHQWVPFALGLGAILCLLPYVIWRMLSGFLWLDTHALTQTLEKRQNEAGRDVILKSSALVVLAGLKGGNNRVLTVATLARKAMSCAVCVLEMVLIVVWFSPQLIGGGEDGVDKNEEKRDLNEVNVTVPDHLEDVPLPLEPFFCTVEFTHHQNQQSMTMQCLLPLNEVFTKAFTFFFYFFLALLVLSLWDVFYWLGRLFLPRLRHVTLLRHLSAITQSQSAPGTSSAPFTGFLQNLGPDGHLVVATIDDQCGSVEAMGFISHLWQFFKKFQPLTPTPLSPSSASQSLSPEPLSLTSAHLNLSSAPQAGSSQPENSYQAAGNSHGEDIALQPMGDDDTAKLWKA